MKESKSTTVHLDADPTHYTWPNHDKLEAIWQDLQLTNVEAVGASDAIAFAQGCFYFASIVLDETQTEDKKTETTVSWGQVSMDIDVAKSSHPQHSSSEADKQKKIDSTTETRSSHSRHRATIYEDTSTIQPRPGYTFTPGFNVFAQEEYDDPPLSEEPHSEKDIASAYGEDYHGVGYYGLPSNSKQRVFDPWDDGSTETYTSGLQRRDPLAGIPTQPFNWSKLPETAPLNWSKPLVPTLGDSVAQDPVPKWRESLSMGQGTTPVFKAPALITTGYVFLTSPSQDNLASSELSIGIYMHREYRSCTFARQAIEQLLNYAISDLGLHRIQARVIDNSMKDRALTLFTQMRFTHEGTRRRSCQDVRTREWKDVTYLGMLDTQWLMRKYIKPAPRGLWEEMFARHAKEREDLLAWEESRGRGGSLKRSASTETIKDKPISVSSKGKDRAHSPGAHSIASASTWSSPFDDFHISPRAQSPPRSESSASSGSGRDSEYASASEDEFSDFHAEVPVRPRFSGGSQSGSGSDWDAMDEELSSEWESSGWGSSEDD